MREEIGVAVVWRGVMVCGGKGERNKKKKRAYHVSQEHQRVSWLNTTAIEGIGGGCKLTQGATV